MSQPSPRKEVELALAMAANLRHLAEHMMDRAHEDLNAGRIPLSAYYTVSERSRQLVQQAAQITYEADRHLVAGLQREYAELAALTKEVDASFAKLKRVDDLLELSMKIVVAAGSLVLAVVNPGLSTLGAAGAAMADAARAIGARIPH
jgi:hypothetical protein